MRSYRKIVGWTVRVIAFPFLALWLLALIAVNITSAALEASTAYLLEFAARMEEWETAQSAPEWRPLRESVLEQRETDWTPIKEEDERLDT